MSKKKKGKGKTRLPQGVAAAPEAEVEEIETEETEVEAETIEVEEEVSNVNEGVVLTKSELRAQNKEAKLAAKAAAEAEREKQLKKQSKPKRERKSLVKRLKETGSEVRKVTWPKFSTVVKSTGVVIAVVLFFTVVLFGFDSLLGWLYNLFIGAIGG
ncbi:MAG: preprotein translocase subunit SecE [Christensenellaceae bacterium]|jgi:preprotein translocase subunit SecE|nr:preprotein translocase subunit SecE [Christensenellaceae bacterium]